MIKIGLKLVWQVPDSESDFDYVYIYRASSKTGTYSEVTNQDISDNTYYDMNGTSTSWYKIRFYDSSNSIWSDYSDPLKGSSWNAYCSIDDVKEIIDVPTSITDIQLYKLIRMASLTVNHDISNRVHREKVDWVSDVKTNDIDGSNTTYYTKNYPVGDMNDDFTVDEDDIEVYQILNETETELTVSSFNVDDGKFVLSTAPAIGSTVEINYVYTPKGFRLDPVNELIRKATSYLAAYLMQHKIDDTKLITKASLDRLSITRQPDIVKYNLMQYENLINRINGGMMEVGEVSE